MKGLIVVNAYIKNNSQISQAERIREEFCAQGVDVVIKKNFDLARIFDGKVVADKYDFCVFLDKDKACSRLLEKSGIRLFNRSESIEICDDKMLTHIALANNNINMPDCIYAPLCYYADANADEKFLKSVADKLNFPLVAKTCFGSLGSGVTLIKNMQELRIYEQKNMLTEHFYQRFINCGCGEDIRVIVIGGKYICSMKRHNDNDFRSNIELGGTGEKFVADKNIIDLCERVASILKLDYCGIDILRDKDGKIYVCEVNSNAFFAAAERCCNVNIAATYVKHIIKELGERE
jgi:ribosomal protein S6--L-glutamate ligase/gamma-F420-2:alpha-L-glutamate ligase